MATSERVTISLNPEDDRDLLQWLASQRNRSEAVRRALRYYIKAPGLDDLHRQHEQIAQQVAGIDLAEILTRLDAIERRIARVALRSDGDGSDEPEEALAALDALADLA
jgi:Arc/MetJ-type ribon-helix-helix transcriptional regulator